MEDKSSDCFNKIPTSMRPLVNKLILKYKHDQTPNRLVKEADLLLGGGKLTDCIVREWKALNGIEVY